MNEMMIVGSVGVSILLTIILKLVYGVVNIPNKWKPHLAVLIGIGLAIVVMFYNLPSGSPIGFKMWIDFIVRGFMIGATSVGLYEMIKTRRIL